MQVCEIAGCASNVRHDLFPTPITKPAPNNQRRKKRRSRTSPRRGQNPPRQSRQNADVTAHDDTYARPLPGAAQDAFDAVRPDGDGAAERHITDQEHGTRLGGGAAGSASGRSSSSIPTLPETPNSVKSPPSQGIPSSTSKQLANGHRAVADDGAWRSRGGRGVEHRPQLAHDSALQIARDLVALRNLRVRDVDDLVARAWEIADVNKPVHVALREVLQAFGYGSIMRLLDDVGVARDPELTKITRDEWLDLYSKRGSISALSLYLGCDRATVRRHLRCHGIYALIGRSRRCP